MKRLTFLLFALSAAIPYLSAQTVPGVAWAKKYGSTAEDMGEKIVTDAAGNVYTTGSFNATATFGALGVTSAGATDIFLSKSDAAGNMLWVKRYGGTGSDYGQNVTVDADGNIYVTGSFTSSGTFGSYSLYTGGAGGVVNVFVMKVRPNGNVVWAKNFGGGTGYSNGVGLNVDRSGSVYITGDFNASSITFGSTTLTTTGKSIFMARLDSNGTAVWANRFGGTDNNDYGYAVTSDAAGNTYSTGICYSSSPFFGSYGLSGSYQKGYVVKTNAQGNVVWLNPSGTSGHGIATDAAGNIYTTGRLSGTTTLGPYAFTSLGGYDVYITKTNPDGTVSWATKFGSTSHDFVESISTDAAGNSYIVASFGNTVTFQTGVSSAAGNYLIKVDAAGNLVWTKQFGDSNDLGKGVHLDNLGQLHITGYLEGTAAFDAVTLTSTGNKDIFVVKLGADCSPTTLTLNRTACGSYTRNGQTYTTSGTYTQTPQNSAGCDSTVTLNLTIKQNSGSTLTRTACGSYTLNGLTYTTGGTYTQVRQNAAGCDSTITLNLTVKQNSASTLNRTACGSYTLNGQTYTASGTYTQVLQNAAGCDSTVTLNLTVNRPSSSTLTQTACGSYTLNGQTYTGSGTYIQVRQNAAGCDSTITLNLTIRQNNGTTLTRTVCSSYVLNGQTYTASGTYTQVRQNAAGCDSTITLHLTVTPQITATMTRSACGSYTLNGQTYTTSGTYTQLHQTAAGCDSLLTLQLTVKQATASTLTRTGCGSYTLNGQTYTAGGTYTQVRQNAAGCDSTITLNLTIKQNSGSTLTQTACGSYTFNGQTYTGSGTYTRVIPNAAGCDSTITLHLTVKQPSASTLTQTACGSYTLNNITYTNSGTYTQTRQNAVGCDSTITLHLTIRQASASTLTRTGCESYTLNGQTYNASGTYTQVRQNAAGCDSTITLNLTIRQPGASTLTQTACGSYTFNGQTYTGSGTYTRVIPNAAGCDSTVTLHLTIKQPSTSTLTRTACGSYTLNNITYNVSGTYTQVMQNAVGCDSTIMLHLTISSVNTAVTQNGTVLTASATGASYRWINCKDNSPVPGATAQTYTVTANGDYAVVVNVNGCSDTSDCLAVYTVGIAENKPQVSFTLFPNPSTGAFTVRTDGAFSDARIRIHNSAGQTVYVREHISGTEVRIDLGGHAPGLYLFEWDQHGLTERMRFILQ